MREPTREEWKDWAATIADKERKPIDFVALKALFAGIDYGEMMQRQMLASQFQSLWMQQC